MKRREVLGAAIALGAQPRLLYAQTRSPTIGLLWIESAKPSLYAPSLLKGLREHGYVPGRNVRLDDRFLVADYEGLASAAQRLVAEKPDIILVLGATAVLAAHKATTSIPIVMVGSGDPVRLGVVKSLSRPQTNVTGLSSLTLDLSGKRLELLKETFPKIRRVAVALSPSSEAEVAAFKNYEAAARSMGLEVRGVEIRNAGEISSAIATVEKTSADAIVFVGSTLFRANHPQLIAAVGKTRFPAIYVDDMYTEAGGLLSYGPSILENFRRSAGYMDKILKGAKPGDLPIEQPARLELIVNAKTAKAQGIQIPRAILLRADKVIE